MYGYLAAEKARNRGGKRPFCEHPLRKQTAVAVSIAGLVMGDEEIRDTLKIIRAVVVSECDLHGKPPFGKDQARPSILIGNLD